MDQSTGSSETESTAQHYLRKLPILALRPRPTPRPEESLIVAEEGVLFAAIPGLPGHQHHFSEPVSPWESTEMVFSVPKHGQRQQKSYYRRHPPRGRTIKEVGLVDALKQRKVGEMLLKYLDLTEVARLFSVSTAFQTSAIRKLLKRRRRELILAGLSASTRLKLWQYVASPMPHIYHRLCSLPNVQKTAITADIERTNVTESLSQIEKQRIYRILNGLCQALPQVGYCQCLVFITTLLVKGCLSEERCFWLLHTLLIQYDLREVVSCGFEKLRLLCYQFDCFLNSYLRETAEKLRAAELSAELYALRWLLTLFCYELPKEQLYILWDLFFVERWKVMIRAGLALVQVVNGLKEKISGCELFCLLRSINGDSAIALQVLSSMYSFKVTTNLMTQLTSFYQQSNSPILQLDRCVEGTLRWEQRTDDGSDWQKMQQLLDETLCMEDLASPGGPLNSYFLPRDESFLVICSCCGSSSHSALYCDKEEAAQSFCSSNLA
jgi:hypothetical protein